MKVELCSPRGTKRSKAVFEEAVKERDTYKVDLRKVPHKRQGKRDIELSGLELDKPDKWVDRERCEGGLGKCTQVQGAADGIAIGIVKLSRVPGGPQIETIYTGQASSSFHKSILELVKTQLAHQVWPVANSAEELPPDCLFLSEVGQRRIY